MIPVECEQRRLKIQSLSMAVLYMCLLLFPSFVKHCWSMPNTNDGSSVMMPKLIISPTLEQSILREDWKKVVDMLPEDEEPNMPTAFLLIKGHACLAMNRNNDSLCLFLRTSSEEDLRDWERWTEAFVEKHPGILIAHYFRGDSYARLREWDQSIKHFDAGLTVDPNHFLTLHSRAVVMALNGRWEEARKDFRTCRRVAPKFAEVHTSWGTYLVQRRTNPKIALEAFDLALKYSDDYVLALNGKGSMETIIGEDLKSAAEHLQQASDLSVDCLSSVGPMVNLNALVLGAKIDEDMKKKIAKATGIEPGMTLDEQLMKFNSLSPSNQQAVVDYVANARHFNRMRIGDMFTPDSTNMHSSISGEIGLKGNIPYAGIKGTRGLEISKDISRTTMHNIDQQSMFLDGVALKYGIKPSEGYNSIGNNIKSFIGNQFGIGRDFSHTGGVSSKEIEDTIDRGDWKTVTLYGVLYTASEKPQQEEDKS